MRIPENAQTGEVTVERDGLVSNAKIFYVKRNGFNLYASQDEVRMQPGEEREVDVNVSGYGRAVSLTAGCEVEGIAVSIAPASVTPNAMCRLTIDVSPEVGSGSYEVVVTGRSDELTTQKSIRLIVGQAFEITTEKLPACMEDTGYEARLETQNADGTVLFKLAEGELPLGLFLSERGVIQGRTNELGVKSFTIEAQDGKGRVATKELRLTVEENAWAYERMDAGRSGYNPVGSPADGRTAWKSKGFAGAREILTGRKRVFVLGDAGVQGLDKQTGGAVYKYEGGFTAWVYASGTLFLLDKGHVLHALDSYIGSLKWRRQGVDFFTTDGNRLLCKEGEKLTMLDATDGNLVAEFTGGLPADGLYVWLRNNLYRAKGSLLTVLDVDDASGGASWRAVYAAQAEIIEAAAQGGELALLCRGGRLVLLDSELRESRSLETGVPQATLLLGKERLILVTAAEVTAYRRADLTPLYRQERGGVRAALAGEKLFVVSEYGITAFNGYDGNVIWSAEYEARDIALAGEKAYALAGSGEVLAYDGPDNLLPPDTRIVLTPSGPDGENGYYVTLPTAEITARDAESCVSEVRYRLNSPEWRDYGGLIEFGQGESSLVAYATDNHGLRSADVIANLRVDATAPVTTVALGGTQKNPGYYETPIRVEFTAEDGFSGVGRILYRLDGANWNVYAGPLEITEHGSHSVEYRAVDNAGNREEARTAAFTIDYGAPSVELEVYTEPGLGVAYVKASDEASAVTLVEYRVNGGAVNAYTAPVVITSPGSYTVEARATDAAGWVSEWQSIGMEVKSIQESEWVSGLRFAYPYFGRGVVRNVGVGEHLFCPPRGRHNNIKALPSYIPGADFIRCAYTDRDYRGHAFIRFQAGVDCDVYVFKHKDSRADLRGWELVERDFPVEPAQYYRGGADVYRKRVARGDVVVIPGAEIRHGSGYGNLVFVQYARDNLVHIVGPRPGEELYPLAAVTYRGFVAASGGYTARWQVRYADGEWRELGTGISGEFTLPYTDDELGMRLRLTVTMSGTGEALTCEEEYVIRNNASLTLTSPGPGAQVLCGQSVRLEYNALGLTGRTLPPGAVSFFARRAGRGDEWTPCAGGLLRVPDGPGELELKAVAVLAPGHAKEFGFKLWAVKEYTPVTIVFGRVSRRNDYSLGAIPDTHKSGRVYGFEPDHSGRIVSFWAIKPFHFRTRLYAIRLLHDGGFLFCTGKGRFRVVLTLGPVDRRELAYVRIAGQRMDINGAAHKTAIFKVTRDVEVSDGILVIQGKEGLGLISLEVLKLSPDEAGPPTEQVERLDEYGILEHYGPPPSPRHDDKNNRNNKGRNDGRGDPIRGKDKRSDVKGGGR